MTESLPNVTLPSRPRLVPGLDVIERRADEVQIGLDPRHAVVATGLPPVLVDVLRSLDGSRSIGSLLALARDEHAERLRDLLTGLTARGLIEDAEPARQHGRTDEPDLWSLHLGRRCQDTAANRARSTVLVHGGGRLAVAVATLLAAAGVGHIEAASTGRVSPDDLGSGHLDADIGRPRRQAIADAVRRANPAARTGRIGGDRSPDLVLLTDAVVPAPEVVRELTGSGQPHLAVRVRDGIGLVGPYVVPGRSSCLRCADLYRTSLDSCWPRVAGQLAGRYQRADLCSVHAAAALAAGQALRILSPEDEPPPTWNGTLEIDSHAGTLRRRDWPPHPDCGCGAYRPRRVT
ncbi:ThiF family protein [Prauserella shujinwangii]|uniref:ThiF family protein n=1 Tax=Prauserella shujinwangii TaxID=1453103 RepID=A0A2T0LKS2_9PSEU|nr:ThiF family adenylyltransferase [Prauserella shujinwangii]PRX43561.1 ThiF family protein [Prauserella shujinwangii]